MVMGVMSDGRDCVESDDNSDGDDHAGDVLMIIAVTVMMMVMIMI
jgi:hypothetical protein